MLEPVGYQGQTKDKYHAHWNLKVQSWNLLEFCQVIGHGGSGPGKTRTECSPYRAFHLFDKGKGYKDDMLDSTTYSRRTARLVPHPFIFSQYASTFQSVFFF